MRDKPLPKKHQPTTADISAVVIEPEEEKISNKDNELQKYQEERERKKEATAVGQTNPNKCCTDLVIFLRSKKRSPSWYALSESF